MYNSQLNETKCCQQGLCTSCYLEVRPPRQPTDCIFCNAPAFSARARASNPRPPGWEAVTNNGSSKGSGKGSRGSKSGGGGGGGRGSVDWRHNNGILLSSGGSGKSSPKPIGGRSVNADAGMLTPSNQQQPSVLSPASSASRSAEQQQRSKTDAHTPPLSSSHERRELEATMRRQRVATRRYTWQHSRGTRKWSSCWCANCMN